MDNRSVKIDQLSSTHVRGLLALAAGSRSPNSATEISEIIRQALVDNATENLRVAVRDLRRPISTSDDGPLSFWRLVGSGLGDKKCVQDMTYVNVLTAPGSSAQILTAFVAYGELLCLEAFPITTRLTGALIRILALAALVVRHGRIADGMESALISTTLKVISTTQILPKRVLDDYADLIDVQSIVE